MEYRKGQWYEVFGMFPDTKYLKFKEKDDTKVYFTERIRREDNSLEIQNDHICVIEREYMKEVPLEVVSPYLPEEHPDKLPEKGKYYYVEEGHFFMIGKVDVPFIKEDSSNISFRGKCAYVIGRFHTTVYKNKSWCYKNYNRTFRLATQEEIDWLEYCNKIDKYVTKDEFLKQTKSMKKENFTIEGSKSLKKAFIEEVNTFHSTGKHHAAIHDEIYRDNYLCVCIEYLILTNRKESKHFKLPQDWDKAIQACKDFWKVETKKSLYFGDVEFICDKKTKTAATSYGKVTLDQIEDFIGYIENPPKIAGYSLTVHSLTSDNYTTLEGLVQSYGITLGIGCKRGKLVELKAIANFLRG